jgi:hypothetical protein
MRFLRPVLLACLLVLVGPLLVGCHKQPPSMKGQPTNLGPGTEGFDKRPLGGQKTHLEGRQ